jgi:hypothetical protein
MCNTDLTGRIDFSTLLEFGFLTSVLESFWVLSTLVLSRSPCCIPLYSTMTYTQERNKTHKNRLELVTLILLWVTFHLCLSLRASAWSWLEQLRLESETVDFFDLYNQDVFSCPCLLDFLIQHILTLGVLWLYMEWLISWTQPFTCSSPSHPVPRHQVIHLLFFDVWFIVAKPLLNLLQSPSWSTQLFVFSMSIHW